MSSASPEQREYAALLLQKATDDLQAARALAHAAIVEDVVGFHAQQAVEKAAKVVLVLAGVQFPHVHDLERLIALAAETAWPPPVLVADAGWLTPWAVQFRYDEVIESFNVVAALAVADAAVLWASEAIRGS